MRIFFIISVVCLLEPELIKPKCQAGIQKIVDNLLLRQYNKLIFHEISNLFVYF